MLLADQEIYDFSGISSSSSAICFLSSFQFTSEHHQQQPLCDVFRSGFLLQEHVVSTSNSFEVYNMSFHPVCFSLVLHDSVVFGVYWEDIAEQ